MEELKKKKEWWRMHDGSEQDGAGRWNADGVGRN